MRHCRCTLLLLVVVALVLMACGSQRNPVKVTTVSEGEYSDLGQLDPKDLERLAQIKEAKKKARENQGIKNVIEGTPSYTVGEYLAMQQDTTALVGLDYRLGGYDVIDISVYEEADLSRTNLRISADGYISFPLVGRLRVADLTTSQVEELISDELAKGQFVLEAHVSVTVSDYKSKQYMVLGSVKAPGTYPLKAKERLLDAISRAGGIDFEQGGKRGMIVRTETPEGPSEKKIVIWIDLPLLLKGGDQLANIQLNDRDLIYIPKAEHFFIIGQVQKPGSYLYQEKEVTLVEAISEAGGFTPIAARNRTRIIRVEGGLEKIIEVKVDAITKAGKKANDVRILPGDIIVVPESFF